MTALHLQSISDQELPEAIASARQGGDVYYAIVGLLERDRVADAEALAAEIGSIGFVEGFEVLAEFRYGPTGTHPDPVRCLELATKHTDPERPYHLDAAALAGWAYERTGEEEMALRKYELATSDPEQDEPAICHAWVRRAALLLRPGPNQDILKAAECFIGAVSSDYHWPEDLEESLPLAQDGSWHSADAFKSFFNSAPEDRRGELALRLLWAGLLEPHGISEDYWWL